MAAPTRTGSGRQAGFAYIALLAALTVLMLVLGMAAADIAQSAQREREADLLFIGRQYQRAIGSYYERSPHGSHQYPQRLEDLLQDRRHAKPMHHLRRIFVDPMTGSREWGLLRNEQGRIVGVHSLSRRVPLKTHFDFALQQSFGDRPILSYADWTFVYHAQDGSADLAGADLADDVGDAGANAVESSDQTEVRDEPVAE